MTKPDRPLTRDGQAPAKADRDLRKDGKVFPAAGAVLAKPQAAAHRGADAISNSGPAGSGLCRGAKQLENGARLKSALTGRLQPPMFTTILSEASVGLAASATASAVCASGKRWVTRDRTSNCRENTSRATSRWSVKSEE